MAENETLNVKEVMPLLGYSKYKYDLPVKLQKYIFLSSSAHTGSFKHALDISVPHPDTEKTVVYAPISGIVDYVVMNNIECGPTDDFKDKLNYVNIRVGEGERPEFVEMGHLDPYINEKGEKLVLKVGDLVEVGQPIAVVGLNGWIENNNQGKPDPHVHIMVGQWNHKDRKSFKSLKIRWR